MSKSINSTPVTMQASPVEPGALLFRCDSGQKLVLFWLMQSFWRNVRNGQTANTLWKTCKNLIYQYLRRLQDFFCWKYMNYVPKIRIDKFYKNDFWLLWFFSRHPDKENSSKNIWFKYYFSRQNWQVLTIFHVSNSKIDKMIA